MSDPNLRGRLKQIVDLYKAGQKSEARRLIADVVKANPNDADVWYIAGQVLDQSPKKMKAYERALAINPSHQAARKSLNDLHEAHALLDSTREDSDGLFDDYIDSPAPSSSYSPQTLPVSQPDTVKYANPKIVAGILSATLLVGIFLGALCLGTINSGKFLGIVFAPTATPSNTPTATPTSTPSRTPTPTVDIAATTTSLASTQQYFDATSTAQALLTQQAFAGTQAAQQFALTTTAVAIINHQIETAIAGTDIAREQLPPTSTSTPSAGGNFLFNGTPQVQSTYIPLNFYVVDAEYSLALDRIIFVSSDPSQLHIYNPANADDTIIPLKSEPRSLSVGPDGLFAAVAQNGLITYVDLKNAGIIKTLNASGDVGEIALGGNGWIYQIPPRAEDWIKVTIHAINIDTNAEVEIGEIDIGARVKLHPDGTRLYTVTQQMIPEFLTRFDLVDNLPPPRGDKVGDLFYNDTCGNIWFSADGLRIFTSCGYVHRSSADPVQDAIYNGTLPDMQNLASLIHVPAVNRIIGVSFFPAIVGIWDYDTYATVAMLEVPDVLPSDTSIRARGRYVFANSDATQYYDIVNWAQTRATQHFELLVGDL